MPAQKAEIKHLPVKLRHVSKKASLPLTKKSGRTTSHIHELLTSESSASTPDAMVEPVLSTASTITEKNAARNAKKKQRKARLKSLRNNKISATPGSCNSNDSNDSEVERDEPLTSFNADISGVVIGLPVLGDKVELLDVEKLIFSLLQAAREQASTTDAKIYITGGWALHRARQHYCNINLPSYMSDIDVVTDLPYAAIEKYCPMLTRINQVNGLFKGKIGDIHIDVVWRVSLKILSRDALSRDFLPIYIDENGKILDPTGFVVAQLQEGILKSACPVSEVFKRDPLTILRAIYISSKLGLFMTDLKKQIRKDKILLVPSLEQDLLHPYRFNNLIRKIFSQKFALQNYDLLGDRKLGLLAILFPDINSALEENSDWMREQMKKSDNFMWPKLEIIYTNMITCAVMRAVNKLLPEELNKRSRISIPSWGLIIP